MLTRCAIAAPLIASITSVPVFAASVFDLTSPNGTLSGGTYSQTVDGITLTASASQIFQPFGNPSRFVTQGPTGLGVGGTWDSDSAIDESFGLDILTIGLTPTVSITQIVISDIDRGDSLNFLPDGGSLITLGPAPASLGTFTYDIPAGTVFAGTLFFSSADLNPFDISDIKIQSITVEGLAGGATPIPAPAAFAAGVPALLLAGLRRRRSA